MTEIEKAVQIVDGFNAAVNFALDELRSSGDTHRFLCMWRESDWDSIRDEFPEFDLNTVV